MAGAGPPDFTVSIGYDRRLAGHDIAGSVAHARMLARQGVIDAADAERIVAGLEEIRGEIAAGEFPWRPELEDVHMNIERRLAEKIGDAAGRLHTARSRNDQVALDMRMYAREACAGVLGRLHGARQILAEAAMAHRDAALPGYTHLQRGQPVLFAHHLLAYFEMLGRDAERFEQAALRADSMPLGSGAMAGSPYPLDRRSVAGELGFSRVSANSMDAVSDRDFVLDVLSASAICMMHLSRLGEELVLWSSDEFGFVRLADWCTTGSSMMPQKRNPDCAELVRGRTGRVYGDLLAVLTVLKGLPLTYNRDLQEDKEALFDAVDTLCECIEVCAAMIATMTVDCGAMRAASESGAMLATDYADHLAARGMPFREAHGVVAAISRDAGRAGRTIADLSLAELRSYSDLFGDDVLGLGAGPSIDARDVEGGTARTRVAAAADEALREAAAGAGRSAGALGGELGGKLIASRDALLEMAAGLGP